MGIRGHLSYVFIFLSQTPLTDPTAGPALVNIGRYIHAIAIGEEVIGVFRLSAWLVAFITGGYFI
jgi:hypothetical protein